MKIVILSTALLLSLPTVAQNFTRITSGPLVSSNGDSRSVNWVDVNGDGFIDCMISNGPSGGQNNSLYINNGSGGFTAITNDPIVKDSKPSDGASFADTDNDGDLDCFVANWYGVNNLFYTNNGNGSFTQVTTGPVSNDAGYSETGAWGDYDKDGLVDLYVCNSAGSKVNYLYHNNGNNTFTKISSGSLVTDAFESRSVNWTDIDSDGDLDLFVTNEGGGNENIYRNDGQGVFTSVTGGALLSAGRHTMSGSWGDYDNDGDMDVFLANDASFNGLYKNDGGFSFTAITEDTVVKTPSNSFSSAWSDIDNDGDLDLFVTNSFKSGTLLKNFLYLNKGDGTFNRVSSGEITTDLDWSYGCAFGDYDNDGFQDLAVATCRFAGSDRPDLLYHNDGNGYGHITIQLQGVQTNRAAIGSRIRIKTTIDGKAVWQMREISAQSAYCSQNDLRAHFGLKDAEVIDSIKVEWLSGNVDYFTNIDGNQFIRIIEGQGISSVGSYTKEDKLVVFPNPGADQLILSGEQFQRGTTIRITAMNGEVIGMISLEDAQNEISIDLKKISNNVSGTYFLIISQNDQHRVKKVIRP